MSDLVEKLIEKLNSSDSEIIKASIVEDLANTGDSRALKPLFGALNDADAMVRWNAIKGIVRFGGDAFRLLLEALNSSDRFTRRNVIQALGELTNDAVVDRFIRMLMFDEKEQIVLIEIINVLGRQREMRAVEPLVTMLKTDNWEVRWRVIHALGRIRDVKTIQPLLEQLEDPDQDIRWAALIAIERIKKSTRAEGEGPDEDDIEMSPPAPKITGQSQGRRAFQSIKLATSETDKTVTIHVAGDLQSENIDMFSGFIDGCMSGKEKNLSLDLSECNFIDSFALGRLNQIRKRIKSHRRKLIMTGLNPNVKKVFEATRLNELFEIE